MSSGHQSAQRKHALRFFGATLVLAIGVLVFLGTREHPVKKSPNELTFTHPHEMLLGLRALPLLTERYGGAATNAEQNALVTRVGRAIVSKAKAAQVGWGYEFRVLADENTLNAFALPGGHICITTGLLNRLKTEGELAAVLAHQIAHVVKRHPTERATYGLTNSMLAIGGEALQDSMANQLVVLQYNLKEERAADHLALELMRDGGYNPEATIGALRVMATAYYAGAPVEYFATHPNTTNRIADLQNSIKVMFPKGVPSTLSD